MQSSKNFKNPAFAEIYQGIESVMPQLTFYGIIAVYLITAALNVYFIPLPVYLSVPAALALQFGRFSIVFMDFLNPTGRRSPWPGTIATLATAVAITELAFSMRGFDFVGAEFWAIFLFGAMVIAFGYLLEINFISKGAEAYGMKRRIETIQEAPATSTPTPTRYERYETPPQAKKAQEVPTVESIPFDFGPILNGNGAH